MTLDEIEAVARAATPGPWSWFGNTKHNDIYLATKQAGRQLVMSFRRWGMKSAQPQFQNRETKLLADANDIVVYNCDYRKDFCAVDNADARYIAAMSPDVVLDLVARLRAAEAEAEASYAHRACTTRYM